MDEFFKNLIRVYNAKLKEKLSKASEEDFVVCPLIEHCHPEIATEIGVSQVEDFCTSCGRKVCRSNIETKAKVICEECFVGLLYV